jgi:hypothetical protein
MNKFFNIRRFWNVVRNELMLNHKRYILVFLGLNIGAFIVLAWNMHILYFDHTSQSWRPEASYANIYGYYVIAVLACTGFSFFYFNNKIETANYLLIPASTFEKYLSQFLINVVVFVALSIPMFWIDANLARLTAVRPVESFSYNACFPNVQNCWKMWATISGLFSILSLIFAGNFIFKKYAVIKTLIILLIIFAGFNVFFALFANFFYPDETHSFLSPYIYIYPVQENLTNHQFFVNCIACIAWAFILSIGYFKLKEKTI